MGAAAGEAFLFLAALDAYRARLMADWTGIESLRWLCPFAMPMGWISRPLFAVTESIYGQDPLPALMWLLVYWAVIGMVVLPLILAIKDVIFRRRKPTVK